MSSSKTEALAFLWTIWSPQTLLEELRKGLISARLGLKRPKRAAHSSISVSSRAR